MQIEKVQTVERPNARTISSTSRGTQRNHYALRESTVQSIT